MTIFKKMSVSKQDNEYFDFYYSNISNHLNMTNFDRAGGFDPEHLCYPFYSYLKILHTYYIPIIIGVGFLGNFLSCIVFLTTHLKMRSSSYYLAALAIADFGFLCVVLVVHCSFNNVFEIFNTNGLCQFFVYISSVCASLSVWLIVAFTVERFIAIQYPLQRPHICTVARAKIIVVTLTILAILTQIYIFWIAGIIRVKDRDECEMLPDYYEFMKIINFIDTMTTLILPFILIVAMNTMIARNLLLFRKRLQTGPLDDHFYNDKEHTEMQHTNFQTGSSTKLHGSQNSQKFNNFKFNNRKSSDQSEKYSCKSRKMSAKKIFATRNQQNITKMLLLISCVFIALNFPSYVIRLSVYFAFTLQEKTPPEVLWCAQQFAMLLYYTNFSINFLLYAMCGVTFRRCLWQLIRNGFKKFISSVSTK